MRSVRATGLIAPTVEQVDGAVLVVIEGDKAVGVVSERDLARKLDLRGSSARDTSVRDVMSSAVLTVTPGQTVLECVAAMQQDRVRHMVVVQAGGRAVGVISARDVLEDVLAQEQRHTKGLEADRLVMTTSTGSY